MRKNVVLAVTLATGLWASAAHADTILFDPDGAGGLAAVSIDLFDVSPGNLITRGIGGASPVSSQGDVLFQANLGVAKLGIDNQYSNNTGAAGTKDSHKFLAGLPLHLAQNTCLAGPTAPCTLAFDFGTAATNFFRIYAGTTPGNDLTGAGFPAGADSLILEGTWQNDADFFASFTLSDVTPDERLDQFGGNNYPGVNTIEGTGSFKGNVLITSVNALYFPTLAVGTTFFAGSSQQVLPYNATNPSACFTDGTTACVYPGAGNANVGPANGFGPDTVLQSDANFSFNAQVPEPATMALLGLALLSGGASLRRRHARRAAR